MSELNRLLARAALLIACSGSAAVTAGEVAERLTLEGDAARWDFAVVDAATQRLFYTRDNQMDVLDLRTGRVSGSIKGLARVHGVAIAAGSGMGFVTAGSANTVTAFDLQSLRVKATIHVNGTNPDALLYEPVSNKLYVFNHDSDNVDVVDVSTLNIRKTIQASGHPEVAVSDGRGRVYFNIEDHPAIDVIDVATDRLVDTWPLEHCDEPSGIDIDPGNARLFSVCANGRVIVTDTNSGRHVADFPVGTGADGLAFDPATRTIMVSSGGPGTRDMARQVDRDHYQPMPSLATAKGARTLALDARSHRVYLPATMAHRFTILVVGPVAGP
jgi:YVTN family beta-propeller protein